MTFSMLIGQDADPNVIVVIAHAQFRVHPEWFALELLKAYFFIYLIKTQLMIIFMIDLKKEDPNEHTRQVQSFVKGVINNFKISFHTICLLLLKLTKRALQGPVIYIYVLL